MSYKCTIKQGNLLNEDNATFIVNASNTKLILGSGVSMTFKRHCGLELQKEMTAQLEKLDSTLRKGDVVATSSGSADNFEYTLHVAVMDYNQGVRGDDKLPTIEDIKSALFNIESYLEWYTKEKSGSIKLVLPLIGCGVGGLDKVYVIEIYRSYFLREVGFECEVVIYGYNIEDYNLIKGIFKWKKKMYYRKNKRKYILS